MLNYNVRLPAEKHCEGELLDLKNMANQKQNEIWRLNKYPGCFQTTEFSELVSLTVWALFIR
jgi:hypothetical protein